MSAREDAAKAAADKEWRDVAIAALTELTEKVHKLEIDAAVMKTKQAFMFAGVSVVTSAIVSAAFKWIFK